MVCKKSNKKEKSFMEDLMEETTAIKTSNMVYPVPCLKDIEYLKI